MAFGPFAGGAGNSSSQAAAAGLPFAGIPPEEGKTLNRLMKSIFDNLSNW